MPFDSRFKSFVVSDYQFGNELRLETPDVYAMDTAIAILEFLEREAGAQVKNTGWKQGYGLDVAVRVPIQIDDMRADLQTDGSEIVFRRVSGSKNVFDGLSAAIRSLSSR